MTDTQTQQRSGLWRALWREMNGVRTGQVPEEILDDFADACLPVIDRYVTERLGVELDARRAVESVLDTALGGNPEDGTGNGMAADVALVVAQRNQARQAAEAVDRDRAALLAATQRARVVKDILCGIITDDEGDGCQVVMSTDSAAATVEMIYKRLRHERTVAVELLGLLVAPEECRIDHDGDCQEHRWFREGECPNARARTFLAQLDRTPGTGALERFVLRPPVGWLNRVDDLLIHHGAARHHHSALGEALGALLRSWEGFGAADGPDRPVEHWGARVAGQVPAVPEDVREALVAASAAALLSVWAEDYSWSPKPWSELRPETQRAMRRRARAAVDAALAVLRVQMVARS